MIKKLSDRFDQLAQELPGIEAAKKTSNSEFGTYTNVDEEILSTWVVKVKSLISNSCGGDSEHFKAFEKAEECQHMDDSYRQLKRMRPVFLAAKDDFQGGYLVSVRSLVQAELFDSELDQARELLASGYKIAAAVVAGVVLETALKDLCNIGSIPLGKLDKMNADLAKAGTYNVLQQKKITALADIRNKAAHGDSQAFNDNDVMEMIRDVESFLLGHLA